jgi:hypothetical protein
MGEYRATITWRLTADDDDAHTVGYSARDGFKRTKVHTAISEEEATWFVAELVAVGFAMPSFQ